MIHFHRSQPRTGESDLPVLVLQVIDEKCRLLATKCTVSKNIARFLKESSEQRSEWLEFGPLSSGTTPFSGLHYWC